MRTKTGDLSQISRVLCGAAVLALTALVSPALGRSPHEHPDWAMIRQEIGDSKKDLPGQCQAGMYDLLAKIDGLRDRYPDFFNEFDYGPVHKEGTETGHYGVAIYPKRTAGQTYEEALQGGRVLDHTNYWSNITGRYRDRGWDEWRWWGKFGKGRPYDDVKKLKETYWNPDGPVYPSSQPGGSLGDDGPYPPNFLASVAIRFFASWDPNDKTGAVGFGPEHSVPASEPLSYVVKFENLPEATAPAKNVIVRDVLDPVTMDLSTLALGPIVIGGRVIEVPEAAQSFATRIDLRPDKNLLLDIDVTFDPGTSELSWTVLSLDPLTGIRPEDIFNGFLPPNVDPPSGEGQVSFNVAPMPGLANGTVVSNLATIVFDANDPIQTPTWTNRIDTEPPTSAVDSAIARSCSQTVDVSWSASDGGAGVRDVRVLVARDAEPPVEWHVADGDGSAAFSGAWGHTYTFSTVASDRAANVETAPLAPDAVVTLDDCGPHDLAITKILPQKLTKQVGKQPRSKMITVVVENRGVRPETIRDIAMLSGLVDLSVDSLGACAAPAVSLRTSKPQKPLPLVLAPGKSVKVVFDVLFQCVNDPAKSTRKDGGHGDYTLRAALDHAALGGVDEHAADDVCPRSVTPPYEIDPYPDGSIRDRGCGTPRGDGTMGNPVVVDLYTKGPG